MIHHASMINLIHSSIHLLSALTKQYVCMEYILYIIYMLYIDHVIFVFENYHSLNP